MQSDAELLEEIAKNPEPEPRRVKPKIAEKQIVVDGDPDRKVMVRCVVDCKPWADEKPLDYWTDYEISYKDALLLESKKFAVILSPTKGK